MLDTEAAAPMMVRGSAIAFAERINALRLLKWSFDGAETGASGAPHSYFVNTSCYTALLGVFARHFFAANDNCMAGEYHNKYLLYTQSTVLLL